MKVVELTDSTIGKAITEAGGPFNDWFGLRRWRWSVGRGVTDGETGCRWLHWI